MVLHAVSAAEGRRLATYLSPFDRPWRVLEALLVVKGEVMLSLGGFPGVFLKSCKVFMRFHLGLKVLSKKRKLWSLVSPCFEARITPAKR